MSWYPGKFIEKWLHQEKDLRDFSRKRFQVHMALREAEFLEEAFLCSLEEIADAVFDRAYNRIVNETEMAKVKIIDLANRAKPDIRDKYLPFVLDSFDVFRLDVEAALKEYTDKEKAWKEIEEIALRNLQDRNLELLVMAVMDILGCHY